MPIKILRVDDSQRYRPVVVCDLCGQVIDDGSAHILYEPDANGGFNPRFVHRYPWGKGGFSTCKYHEVPANRLRTKFKGKVDPLQSTDGVSFFRFLDELHDNSNNGKKG